MRIKGVNVLAALCLAALVPAVANADAVNGACGNANGAVLTAMPSSGLCAAGTPFDLSGYGPWTWGCAGAGGGSDAACSAALASSTLSVGKAGTGSGTVSSAPPHAEIDCGATCSRAYGLNAVVNLSASPAAGSEFAGWSGCDVSYGSQCTVTVNGAKGVTATFNGRSTDVKIGESFFDSIMTGFSALANGDVIQLRNHDIPVTGVFNRSVPFTIKGGYDSGFGSVVGTSTIRGALTVSSGTVKLENIRVAAPPPTAGNGGAVSTVDVTGSGASLLITPATGSSGSNGITYQAYYSATQTLSGLSDILAYGSPIGTSAPAAIGRAAGKVNKGLILSGNDYVDAGNGAALSFGTGSFSVETWINASSWSNLAGVISKGRSSSSEPGYTLRELVSGSDNVLQFVVGNGAKTGAVGMIGLQTGRWYHVVGVADRTKNVLSLYVNGTLAGSADISGISGSTNAPATLTIGRQNEHSFNGIIDEAAVYNRALTDDEVAARYNAGAGVSVAAGNGLAAGWRFDEASGLTATDISGDGNTGTLNYSSGLATVDIGGLAASTRYSVAIVATDQYGGKVAYTPVTVTTGYGPVLPISFGGTLIPYSMYMSAVADMNGDGLLEAMGTLNDGQGNLNAFTAASKGLSRLFTPGRVNRMCSVVDLNGDGLPDIVCNTYSAEEPYTFDDPAGICQSFAKTYSADSIAMLFINNGDGTFTEDSAFSSKQIRGFGETILIADFNNDGYPDIFLPYYSYCSPNEHSYLLLNDGAGHFTDVSDDAGVALRGIDINYRVEGAHAVDLNLDGWIDFYVGSHLFINNGVKNGKLTFTDQEASMGLPTQAFDEGAKFTDWNNDGYLDLVIHHPTTGPVLWQFDGIRFTRSNAIAPYLFANSDGLNIFDMNNDGREDIITSGGSAESDEVGGSAGDIVVADNPTVVLLNNGAAFERSNPTPMDAWGQDVISFGDITGSGKLDVLKREADSGGNGLAFYKNSTAVPPNSFFKIEMVGQNGEHNQHGRIVKVYPQNHPGTIFTRFVDSGSGYLTVSPYEIFVGTPYQEPHRVEAYYYGKVVTFTINPGERKRVFPDGSVASY